MKWIVRYWCLVETGLRFSGSFIWLWRKIFFKRRSQHFTQDKGHLHLLIVKKSNTKYQLVLKIPANVLGGKILWKFGLSWVTFFPYNDFSTIQISRPNNIFFPLKIFHHTVTICNVLFQLIVNYFQISDQITVYKTVSASQFAFLSSHLFSKTRTVGWPSASYFKPVYFC